MVRAVATTVARNPGSDSSQPKLRKHENELPKVASLLDHQRPLRTGGRKLFGIFNRIIEYFLKDHKSGHRQIKRRNRHYRLIDCRDETNHVNPNYAKIILTG